MCNLQSSDLEKSPISLSLSRQLNKEKLQTQCICLKYKSDTFQNFSRQKKLENGPTTSIELVLETLKNIYQTVIQSIQVKNNGNSDDQPFRVRLIGVRATDLTEIDQEKSKSRQSSGSSINGKNTVIEMMQKQTEKLKTSRKRKRKELEAKNAKFDQNNEEVCIILSDSDGGHDIVTGAEIMSAEKMIFNKSNVNDSKNLILLENSTTLLKPSPEKVKSKSKIIDYTKFNIQVYSSDSEDPDQFDTKIGTIDTNNVENQSENKFADSLEFDEWEKNRRQMIRNIFSRDRTFSAENSTSKGKTCASTSKKQTFLKFQSIDQYDSINQNFAITQSIPEQKNLRGRMRRRSSGSKHSHWVDKLLQDGRRCLEKKQIADEKVDNITEVIDEESGDEVYYSEEKEFDSMDEVEYLSSADEQAYQSFLEATQSGQLNEFVD